MAADIKITSEISSCAVVNEDANQIILYCLLPRARLFDNVRIFKHAHVVARLYLKTMSIYYSYETDGVIRDTQNLVVSLSI